MTDENKINTQMNKKEQERLDYVIYLFGINPELCPYQEGREKYLHNKNDIYIKSIYKIFPMRVQTRISLPNITNSKIVPRKFFNQG